MSGGNWTAEDIGADATLYVRVFNTRVYGDGAMSPNATHQDP